MNKIIFVLLAMFSVSLFAEEIGTVGTNGFLVKDEIKINSFVDPQVPGIVCYMTYYDRALSVSDASHTELKCVQVGSISSIPANNKNLSHTSKSFFRDTVVARFYDKKNNVFVYIAYMKSVKNGSTSHTMSVVKISGGS